MIIKIIIGIVIYILALVVICMFLKGATMNVDEYEEEQEAIEFLKKYEKDKKK